MKIIISKANVETSAQTLLDWTDVDEAIVGGGQLVWLPAYCPTKAVRKVAFFEHSLSPGVAQMGRRYDVQ